MVNEGLKQNIREKLDYYKLWETKGLLNDYDTGQKHALMDMLKRLDEATKQIQDEIKRLRIDAKEAGTFESACFSAMYQKLEWVLAVLEGAEQK